MECVSPGDNWNVSSHLQMVLWLHESHLGSLIWKAVVNQIRNLQICLSWFCMDYQSPGKSRTSPFRYHFVQFCCVDQSCQLTLFLTDFLPSHDQFEQADKILRISCDLLLSCILLAIILCSLYLREFKCRTSYFNPNYNIHN